MSIGQTRAARAHANIALVKYWGKRNPVLNLPATGSLSITLAALTTTTRVRFRDALVGDKVILDGAPAPGAVVDRISRWLDLVRDRAGTEARAEIETDNDFPTASGLASSASGYAALAVAATAAADLELPASELSALARRGSGSAARSIFGGFVEMLPGRDPEGADCFAEPIEVAPPWPLRMVIAVVGGGAPKTHSSRDAMQHCAETSPLYDAWIHAVPGDIDTARTAIEARDLDALGRVTEASALAMHAAAIASRPPIIYWQPATLACLERVRELREGGAHAYATMDAGPHVKVLTDEAGAPDVASALIDVHGVDEVIDSGLGGPAELIE